MELKEMETKYQELLALNAQLTKKLGEDEDSIRKTEIDKLVAAQIEKLMAIKAGKKIIFSGEPTEGQEKISFQKFLCAVRSHDPAILKTVMEVQTAAQGGYTVPTGFATEILGALNNVAQLPGKATPISQNEYSVRYPAWLTDLTVSWVAEDATKSKSKPTFTYLTSLLKKMAVIVPFTDELLDDNNVGLQGIITNLVGENMGLEIEKIALQGSTGGGDPFNGIVNSSPNTVPQAGASLAYEDIVDVVAHASMLQKYRMGAEFWVNLTDLAKLMKLKDLQNRPLWIPAVSASMPSSLMGYPVVITDQLTAGTLVFGNMKYILLANKKGDEGINVAVSNSAVSPISGSIDQNAFLQDETWFRFVKRQGILVTVPKAFTTLTGVA